MRIKKITIILILSGVILNIIFHRSSLSRKITQYTIEGDLVREYNSITEALNYNGFKNNSNIIQSCKSNSKTVYGYRWKYIN